MLKRSSRIRRALLTGAALMALAGCGVTRVNTQDEVRMGSRTAQAVERQTPAYNDPVVSRIGLELAAASTRPELPWSFRVLQRPEVNAVSLPGGPIYVFEGLLTRIGRDEEMLAALLAHEVGHVEGRHHAEQVERQQWYGLGVAVLDRAAGGDVTALGQVAANLETLSFGRRQEYDADDRAIRLLRRTGRSERGLVRLLEMLHRQGGDSGQLHWLRTHPTTRARIDRAAEQIGQSR